MLKIKQTKKVTFDFSILALFKIVLFFLAIALLYYMSDLVLILLFSFILASALDPFVDWFERSFKFPRPFGVAIIYVVALFVIVMISVLSITPITEQIKELGENIPHYYEQFISQFDALIRYAGAEDNFQSVGQSLRNISGSLNFFAGNAFSIARGFIGGGVSIFLILVLTFYFVVEDKGLKRFFRTTVPLKYQPYVSRLMNRVQDKMGMWLRGQIILSLVIFTVTAIALLILRVKYWLVLALIAGALEVIPFIGPIIALVIAIIFTIAISPVKAFVVFLVYLGIQQLENQILVPQIMKKAVGLNPIIVIVVLLIGTKLGGIIGALISIPIAASLNVFIQDMFEEKRAKEEQLEV